MTTELSILPAMMLSLMKFGKFAKILPMQLTVKGEIVIGCMDKLHQVVICSWY